MNKKLIALAVAGAFAAPVAMAESGNVVIGGKMHFSLDSLKGANFGGGATDNTTNWNVSSNSSNIYFKGSEDLGNGLSAIWQVQSFVSAGGTGNGDGTFESGNTYVGLAGKSWGMVILGKHDSPVKLLSRKVDLFGDQIGDSRNLVNNAGGGGVNADLALLLAGLAPGYTAGFDLRPNNVVAYGTPDFNGFKALVAYVTNVGAGATRDTGLNIDPNAVTAWSGNVTYENGPIFVGLGYEKHDLSKVTNDPTTAISDEKIWRLAAGYNFGDFKLVGLYQQESGLNRDVVVGPTLDNNVKRKTWGLGGAYKLGANTLKLQYYRAGDLTNTNLLNAGDTGASLWALGVDHALSKRTTIYAAYAQTSNDGNNPNGASYSAFGGGHGDNPGTVAGKDPRGFSLGVIHSF